MTRAKKSPASSISTSVWLLWLHDSVLAVYGSYAAAMAAMEEQRIDIDNSTRGTFGEKLAWQRSHDGNRWWTSNGGIARLEVQERPVY